MNFKLKFDKSDVVALLLVGGAGLFCWIKHLNSPSQSVAGHEYVDLGLSVCWADENLGCSDSYPYGSFYQWGVPELPDKYTKEHYKWFHAPFDASSVKKYYIDSIGCSLTELEPKDDPVARTWGEGWRSPTKSELRELIEKCKWHYQPKNEETGVNGFRVVGPNGNSIFLPMVGYNKASFEHSAYGAGVYGCYWSSSLEKSNSLLAVSLYFTKKEILEKSMYRCHGFTVRPVIKN